MRYIQVHEPIVLRPNAEQLALDPTAKPESISFRKYAFGVWLNDDRAIAGGFIKQVRWAKVIDAFEVCETGKPLPLEDEDWQTLKAIVESPTMRMPPMVTVQLMAFSRAVLDAPDKLPLVLAEAAE